MISIQVGGDDDCVTYPSPAKRIQGFISFWFCRNGILVVYQVWAFRIVASWRLSLTSLMGLLLWNVSSLFASSLDFTECVEGPVLIFSWGENVLTFFRINENWRYEVMKMSVWYERRSFCCQLAFSSPSSWDEPLWLDWFNWNCRLHPVKSLRLAVVDYRRVIVILSNYATCIFSERLVVLTRPFFEGLKYFRGLFDCQTLMCLTAFRLPLFSYARPLI